MGGLPLTAASSRDASLRGCAVAEGDGLTAVFQTVEMGSSYRWMRARLQVWESTVRPATS
eukprot:m.65671 g.65671  ORF g.65671 m.65671 type:complete len:60 (+) comp18000_c0_seq2:317-496(+)